MPEAVFSAWVEPLDTDLLKPATLAVRADRVFMQASEKPHKNGCEHAQQIPFGSRHFFGRGLPPPVLCPPAGARSSSRKSPILSYEAPSPRPFGASAAGAGPENPSGLGDQALPVGRR